MSTLNKVTLIGYLGRDPETRSTASGELTASLTLATTETWKDKITGEKKEATEWHRVVLFRKLADIADQYLKKGSLVYIEGKLHTRKFTGRDDIERTIVEIVGDDMRMLGGKAAMAQAQTELDIDAGAEPVAATPAKRQTPSKREPSRTYNGRRNAVEIDDEAIPF